jgi:flagellar basal-body rod protein FlgB
VSSGVLDFGFRPYGTDIAFPRVKAERVSTLSEEDAHMIVDGLFDRTSQVLDKSIALRMARHGLIASNIANAETPNYRARDIDFESTMTNLIDKANEVEKPVLELTETDSRHMSIGDVESGAVAKEDKEQIVYMSNDDIVVGNDNNTVNLETETARLQWNSLLYSVSAQLLNRRLQSLSDIIESSSRI